MNISTLKEINKINLSAADEAIHAADKEIKVASSWLLKNFAPQLLEATRIDLECAKHLKKSYLLEKRAIELFEQNGDTFMYNDAMKKASEKRLYVYTTKNTAASKLASVYDLDKIKQEMASREGKKSRRKRNRTSLHK